jgi:hypothetical protein
MTSSDMLILEDEDFDECLYIKQYPIDFSGIKIENHLCPLLNQIGND